MASSFPGATDSFPDPLTTSPLNSPSHAVLHQDINDAVEKIETYMGLVKVTDATLSGNSTNITGCFTSRYENYRIVITGASVNTASTLIYLRLLNGTTASITDYFWAMNGRDAASNVLTSDAPNVSAIFTGMETTASNTPVMSATIDLFRPNVAARTYAQIHATGYKASFYYYVGMGEHNFANAYNGVNFSTGTAATMGGTVRIYGYRD